MNTDLLRTGKIPIRFLGEKRGADIPYVTLNALSAATSGILLHEV